VLMTTLAPRWPPSRPGSVFMGANTYIGNAPNLMVKAIAEDRGVKMPSFFGYMLWSGGILVPLFIVMTFIWFKGGRRPRCRAALAGGPGLDRASAAALTKIEK
jgi:hypothetical protein